MGDNKLKQANIAVQSEDWTMVFASNKNLARQIIYFKDGLKPVHRRILYILYKNYDKFEQVKVSVLVGTVLTIYQHGPQSVEGVIPSMAQYWNMNVPYLEPKGSFGTENGIAPSASRYISTCMSEFAYDCFFSEFNEGYVEMTKSFDEKRLEPVWLPCKYPCAILSPSLGLGYGLRSSIPSYNLTEVFEHTIKLIDDPSKSDEYLIPDIPTGCDIYRSDDEFRSIYWNGTGKFTMCPKIKYIEDSKCNYILLTNFPYLLEAEKWYDKFNELLGHDKKQKLSSQKFEGIKYADNDSAETTNIKIYIKPNYDWKDIIVAIKKYCSFERLFSADIIMIDDLHEYRFPVNKYLLEWIDLRRSSKYILYNYLYTSLLEEKHLNDVLIFMLSGNNANKVLEIFKSSKNKSEIQDRLKKLCENHIELTTLQSEKIANMRISDFTLEKLESYKKRKSELEIEIPNTREILTNPKTINSIIKNELREAIKKYGKPRKSNILG